MTREVQAAPGAVRLWLTAIRPRTLGIATAPVLVGTALAQALGATLVWTTALVALACAVLIQVATNLHNDAADFERGNDGADRLGPLRVTAAGWVSAAGMRRAAWLVFSMAFALGVYLVGQGGWPILAIGLASLVAGWAYSGGPRPISHSAFGELCVVLFFGVLAVWGAAWLHGLNSGWRGFMLGIAVGLPAAAVLLTNNLRDLAADARCGRRTLAAVLGDARARQILAALLLAPPGLAVVVALAGLPGAALGVLVLPLARRQVRAAQSAQGVQFNAVLAGGAQTGLVFAVLLTLGLGVL